MNIKLNQQLARQDADIAALKEQVKALREGLESMRGNPRGRKPEWLKQAQERQPDA